MPLMDDPDTGIGLFVADLDRAWLRRSAPVAALAIVVGGVALAWTSQGSGWALHDFGPWAL